MSAATVMSWISVVLSSLLFLVAAVAVAIMGRGSGRALAVAGLVLGLLHNLSNVFVFPLLGRGPADGGFWMRYMAYNVASTVVSFLTWGLIAAGVILMSRMVLRRRPPVAYGDAPGYAPAFPANDPARQAFVGRESRVRLPEGMEWPPLHSTQESIADRLGSLPDDLPPNPPRHPGEGSGATSVRYPGQ